MSLWLALLLAVAGLSGSRSAEARSLDVGQDVYMSTFTQSVSNLLSSLQGGNLTKQNGGTAVTKQAAGGGFSVTIAVVAAVGAGLAALIAFVVQPLQIINHILAVIAIAMLITYLVEDAHYMPGSFLDTYYYPQDDPYTSYGYKGDLGYGYKGKSDYGYKGDSGYGYKGDPGYYNDDYSSSSYSSGYAKPRDDVLNKKTADLSPKKSKYGAPTHGLDAKAYDKLANKSELDNNIDGSEARRAILPAGRLEEFAGVALGAIENLGKVYE